MKRVFFLIIILGFILCGKVYAASLNVLSPNGGEEWMLGTSQDIRWDASGFSQNEQLTVYLNKDSQRKIIAQNIPITQGVLNWKVGELLIGTAERGEGYKVEVEAEGMSIKDDSDQPFTILWKPVVFKLRLTVSSPKEGDKWKEGETQFIKWQSKAKKPYRIELYSHDGSKKVKDIYKPPVVLYDPDGNYSYPWTIPIDFVETPGNYTIKVTMAGSSALSPMFHISKRTKTSVYKFEPKISNYARTKHRTRKIPPKFDEMGTGVSPVPEGKMRVGFDNTFKQSGLFGANKEYVGKNYRGVLFFDISPLVEKKWGMLLKATIYVNIADTKWAVGTVASNEWLSCAAGYYEMKAPWSGFATPAELLSNIPRNQGTTSLVKYDGVRSIAINATSIVRDWIKGTRQNHGLMFVGPDESFQENNDHCISLFDNIFLSIEFLEQEN